MTTPAEREELAEAIRVALVAAELHGGDYVSVEQSRTADEELWSVFYRVFGVEGLPSPPALRPAMTAGVANTDFREFNQLRPGQPCCGASNPHCGLAPRKVYNTPTGCDACGHTVSCHWI